MSRGTGVIRRTTPEGGTKDALSGEPNGAPDTALLDGESNVALGAAPLDTHCEPEGRLTVLIVVTVPSLENTRRGRSASLASASAKTYNSSAPVGWPPESCGDGSF